MPTVAVCGPYRLFFYSNDRTELRQVQQIVTEHAADIERVWNEFFAE